MNILQLCKYYPPAVGGIELVEKNMTRAHRDLGDNVSIVAFAEKKLEQKGEFGESISFIKEDLFFHSAPLSFSFLFSFKKLIAEKKIERVYVHLPNPFMHEVLRFFSSFLKKEKIEVVAVYHSDIVNQRFLGKIYDLFFKLSINIYDLWICSSPKLWSSSTVLSKVRPHKRRVVPFCTEGLLEYRPRADFSGRLLAVGRLVPYKGFEFLIKAINKTNYTLDIIGDGPLYADLIKIAGPNVKLHRRVEEPLKKELFNNSDLMIVSSINRAEAFGMIIVEAFEAGLPVIAPDIDSGVTFLVQNEKTGLLFEPLNEDQLLGCIQKLALDPGLYRSLPESARDFYDQHLSFESFKQNLKALGRGEL